MSTATKQSNPADPDELGPEDKPVSGTFNANDYDWQKHLKRALDDLRVKGMRIDVCWRYYNNEHPRVWMTDSIRERLDQHLITNMSENWCDVAVDAPIKRMSVEGFTDRGSKDTANPIMSDAALNVWKDNDLRLGQKDVYTDAGVAGESFLFVWKDDTKKTGVDITRKDARNVWWPDHCHRAEPDRVVLVWADADDGVWRATCYYKYVVVRLVGPKIKDPGNLIMPQARWFELDPENSGGEHGFEKVPVIRFAFTSERRPIIDRIRTFQDKINKLAANLLVTAEFNAWRKMAILTEQTIDDETLKMRPNRIAVLDPGGGDGGSAPTSIWEGSETDLANYSNEQDKLIDKLFTKATLPGHLKVKADKVAPSGAAYEADEGPFTEYVSDLQGSYGESWHDMFELALGVDVEPQWRDAHVRSEFDQAQTLKLYVDSGVPLSLALKYCAGWSDEQIEELQNAPLSPKEQLAMSAAQALADGATMDGNGQGTSKPPPGQPPATAKPGAPAKPFGGAKPGTANKGIKPAGPPAPRKQAANAKPRS